MKIFRQIRIIGNATVAVIVGLFLWGSPSFGKTTVAKLSCLNTNPTPPYLANLTPYPFISNDELNIEPPISSYTPISMELVARHGSRGLVHETPALASYQLWSYAKTHDLLTPLGEKLGPVIARLMAINSTLGQGDPEIKKPGYGNLSQLGKCEQFHLGDRLGQRMSSLWRSIPIKKSLAGSDTITVQTSGVSRAIQSSDYFVAGLLNNQPELQFDFLPPDRFLLHFKDLNPKTDKAKAITSLERWVYRASRRYQLLTHHFTRPSVQNESQAVLRRLYKHRLLDQLANHELIFYGNDGSNGNKTHHKYVIDDLKSAAFDLYVLRGNTVDLVLEQPDDFSPFFPDRYAAKFNELVDAESFNIKGPGKAVDYGENFLMAFGLVQTLFQNVDNSLAGKGNIANLYFGHDEVQIPLTALLGITPVTQPLSDGVTYSWENNPFRNAKYFPMANNLQWEIYKNGDGKAIIRMLFNEVPTHFSNQCQETEVSRDSYYYDYAALKRCYQKYLKRQFDLVLN